VGTLGERAAMDVRKRVVVRRRVVVTMVVGGEGKSGSGIRGGYNNEDG